MPKGWSKGYTKYTHASVRKISETMKKKKIDNFRLWRDKRILDGEIGGLIPLVKNGDLSDFPQISL